MVKGFDFDFIFCTKNEAGAGFSEAANAASQLVIFNISKSTHKGRHVSSHRKLTVLKNGGILIDNPGMREVGIVDSESCLESTYNKIEEFSAGCRFRDCSHTNEKGCGVIEAVENGQIEKSHYQNFLKLQKEKVHFDSSVAEGRKKDKDFGKLLKTFKKDIRKIK
jgi:ribosome biogenesis GTPase